MITSCKENRLRRAFIAFISPIIMSLEHIEASLYTKLYAIINFGHAKTYRKE